MLCIENRQGPKRQRGSEVTERAQARQQRSYMQRTPSATTSTAFHHDETEVRFDEVSQHRRVEGGRL